MFFNFVAMALSFYLIVDGSYDLNYYEAALRSWVKHIEHHPSELKKSITDYARPINILVIFSLLVIFNPFLKVLLHLST